MDKWMVDLEATAAECELRPRLERQFEISEDWRMKAQQWEMRHAAAVRYAVYFGVLAAMEALVILWMVTR